MPGGIAARRIDHSAAVAAKIAPRGRSSHDHDCEHVDAVTGEMIEVDDLKSFAGPSQSRGDDDRRVRRPMHAQDGDGTVEMVGPIAGTRVVESDDEIASSCGVKPTFDRFPWGEQIGERNGAEIMAEDSAGSGGGSLESGNAGNDLESDAAGAIGEGRARLGVEQFEDECSHRVDSCIARARSEEHTSE